MLKKAENFKTHEVQEREAVVLYMFTFMHVYIIRIRKGRFIISFKTACMALFFVKGAKTWWSKEERLVIVFDFPASP